MFHFSPEVFEETFQVQVWPVLVNILICQLMGIEPIALILQVEFVSSGPCSVHMFAITEEGKVYAWGRNEKGQLGLGDTKDRKCPTLVTGLSDYRVVKAATGRSHSLFLTGNVFGSSLKEILKQSLDRRF